MPYFNETIPFLIIWGTGVVTSTEIEQKVHYQYITHLEISDKISQIGPSCFSLFSSLRFVNITAPLTTICEKALNLVLIEELYLGKHLEVIQTQGISACSVKKLVFPASLKALWYRSVFGCQKLESIDFESPSKLTEIHNDVFSYSKVTSVVFPDSLLSIQAGVFQFTPLTTISFGTKVKTMSNGVFSNANMLTKITIDPENPFYETKNNEIRIKNTPIIHTGPVGFSGRYSFEPEITEIQASAFNGANHITEVIMKTLLTKIGSSAFADCSSLIKVTYESLLFIGDSAFKGTALNSFNITKSVETIGSGAFSGCSLLKTEKIFIDSENHNFNLVDSLLYTKDCMEILFCPTGLVNLSIADNVTSIPSKMFIGMTTLVNVKLPNTLTHIGDQSFASCSGIVKIIFPKSLIGIGSICFESCSSLESVIVEDDSQLDWMYWATFRSCIALKSFYFGKNSSFTNLAESAFIKCSNLQEIELPPSIKIIGAFAFQDCTSLGRFSLFKNSGEITVGGSIFRGCNNLAEIQICLPVIPKLAFCDIYGLKNLIIINTTVIQSQAFKGDADLLSIEFFGISNLQIDSMAFAYCATLEEVFLPTLKTDSFAPDSFSFCTNLISIHANENDHFFRTKNGMLFTADFATLVTCPAGLSKAHLEDDCWTIGPKAFSGCTLLKEVHFGSDLSTISDYCFFGCTSLTAVNIPVSTRLMGQSPFDGCTNLKSIFYCSDTQNITLTSDSPIDPNVQIYVRKTYQGNQFLNHKVIKSSSIGDGGCPNKPTLPFSNQIRVKSVIKVLYLVQCTHVNLFSVE